MQFGYDQLVEVLVTNFLKASFIVGALSIGISLPGLCYIAKTKRVIFNGVAYWHSLLCE